MAKATVENLDKGQLGLMWNFLKMGSGKPNIPVLKEHLDALRQLLIQKTGGEQSCSKEFEIPFEDADTIINCIVIETMQIYLSGGLDKLENSSDAAPVKHGHWVYKERTKLSSTGVARITEEGEAYVVKNRITVRVPYCSECGDHGDNVVDATPYCPNCGAKMDG